MQRTIKICNGVPRMPEWRMAEPVEFEALDGEHIAIAGPNGGGKSMLVDIIMGRHPLQGAGVEYDFAPSRKELVSDNISYIAFKDSYGDGSGAYCLQQRWNQQEIDESVPLVGDLLETAYNMHGDDTKEQRQLRDHLYGMFGMECILDKHIVMLSSGELRKFQIVRSLLSGPRVLIMDNPFIGLDAGTRSQLKALLKSLSQEQQLQIIIVLSKTDDIPDFITHVVEVRDMRVGRKVPRTVYIREHRAIPLHVLDRDKDEAVLNLPYKDDGLHTEEVVRMNGVTIRYGDRTILDRLNWTVKNGERWALSGRNGSGKSTLLSLVCADNPQGYACDISLFGRKRGSGESIWEIKRRIGYVSPEMHRAYLRDLPAIRIVASGLKDSVGLYAKPSAEEYDVCRWWMGVFGLKGKEEHGFMKLSSGEQRLVLLARAFVKDPELLILDEPLHGLDEYNGQMVKDIIEAFCRRRNKTLIMVTHYEEELPSCIDHRIELKGL